MNEQEQLVRAIGTYLDNNFGAIPRRRCASSSIITTAIATQDRRHALGQLLEDVDIGDSLTRGAWVRGIIDKLDSSRDKTIS